MLKTHYTSISHFGSYKFNNDPCGWPSTPQHIYPGSSIFYFLQTVELGDKNIYIKPENFDGYIDTDELNDISKHIINVIKTNKWVIKGYIEYDPLEKISDDEYLIAIYSTKLNEKLIKEMEKNYIWNVDNKCIDLEETFNYYNSFLWHHYISLSIAQKIKSLKDDYFKSLNSNLIEYILNSTVNPDTYYININSDFYQDLIAKRKLFL